MEEGTKFDKGKPKYADFLKDFQDVIEELYKVYEFGTNKYGRGNWKIIKDGEQRFTNAMLRHFFKTGKDDETGINHQTHTAYNAIMRLHYILTNNELKEDQIGCPEKNKIKLKKGNRNDK